MNDKVHQTTPTKLLNMGDDYGEPSNSNEELTVFIYLPISML